MSFSLEEEEEEEGEAEGRREWRVCLALFPLLWKRWPHG
jgi:hypothetical protein